MLNLITEEQLMMDRSKHEVINEDGQFITSRLLWVQFAPTFNFEYNQKELLELALNKGFVTPSGNYSTEGLPLYKVNENY